MSPYRTPGTVDPPSPPKRWGATRYRKWTYLYLRTVVRVDRLLTMTGIVIGGVKLRSLELTKDDEREVIRGMLKPRKPYGGCP